ncbi:MAG: hypothetical protein JST54_02515 [Deltaproteobacteria bacterium]|nr:hypothetical protein [Deltaproteobacteria bacterium]
MTNETNGNDAASPTDSANSNSPKEENVSTAPADVPAAVAPNDSADPAPKAPENKTRPDLLYDPTGMKRDAAAVLRRAAGNTQPLVVAQVKSVEASVAKLQTATGPVAEAAGEVDKAEEAYAPFEAGIKKAMLVPSALLVRVLPGGLQFYARCRTRDAWTTASNVLAQLPVSRLGLSTSEVESVQHAVQLATPARRALEAARAAKKPATVAYMAAKRELAQALKVLRALLEAHRLSGGTMVTGATQTSAPAPKAHAKQRNVAAASDLNGRAPHR